MEYNQQNDPALQGWYNNDAFASGPNGKSRGVAALLALFLGSFGVQYFYVGKPIAGIIMILLVWCTCGIGGILCTIQAIMLFVMNNQDFERKFVTSTSTFPLF